MLPGTYTVALTVDGKTTTRELRVVNDPRSAASAADLAALVDAERRVAAGIARSHDAIEQLRSLRLRAGSAGAEASAAVSPFDRAALAAIHALAGSRSLAQHLAALEYADLKPTPSTLAAIGESCARADQALDQYRQVLTSDLAALNTALATGNRATIPAPPPIAGPACSVR